MPFCPVCRLEYQEGVAVCPDDSAPLVAKLPPPEPPRPDDDSVIESTEEMVAEHGLSDPIAVQIPQALDSKDATLGLNLPTSLLEAPVKAMQDMWTVVTSIPTMFAQVFAGTAPANAFVGPVGIYQFTGEVAQRGGPIALLQLLALLSLNLAIVNLLPFPALDGGRLVFVVLEWLRGGKKIDPQKEGLVHLVGLAILLGLMLIISYFDVLRLIAGQPILPAP